MAWFSRHGGVGIICALASWVGAVQAAEMEWRPISASGTHSINGNEIFLTGSGQRVFLELYLLDWDPDLDGSPVVKIWIPIKAYSVQSGRIHCSFGYVRSPRR